VSLALAQKSARFFQLDQFEPDFIKRLQLCRVAEIDRNHMRDFRITPDSLAITKKHDRRAARRKLNRSGRHCFGNKFARVTRKNLTAFQSQTHAVGVHCYAEFLSEQFFSDIILPILAANNAKKSSPRDESRR